MWGWRSGTSPSREIRALFNVLLTEPELLF
jgi:hypothetical protein